jgi:hypothetical protein
VVRFFYAAISDHERMIFKDERFIYVRYYPQIRYDYIILVHYSGSEEHFLNAHQSLPSQDPCDGEPDYLSEPPVVLDEGAYKVWQESLDFLVEDVQRF